jgi:lipopolysaccharide export system permease protein
VAKDSKNLDSQAPGGTFVNRLDRYIMRNFALGMLPVLLLLLTLFSFLALADELEEVGNGNFTQADAFLVVLYTAPKRIVDLLPVTALLGGLMGLGAMANHQELIAARVAGMSRSRMARPVLLTAILVACGVLLAQSFLVPRSEREASELRARSMEQTSLTAAGRLEFWTRSGQSFVHVNDVLFNRVLSQVEIYNTDEDGRLQQLIQARQATIVGASDWMLEDVIRTDLEGLSARESQLERLAWPDLVSDEHARLLILPLEALAPADLVRYIDHMERNGLDTHHHRVIFWQQSSLVIAVIAMALLSLPMLAGSTRAIPAGQRIVVGGVVGIAFYLLQQLTGHLAGLFDLNPPATILTPVLLLLLFSIYAQYWRGEGMSAG